MESRDDRVRSARGRRRLLDGDAYGAHPECDRRLDIVGFRVAHHDTRGWLAASLADGGLKNAGVWLAQPNIKRCHHGINKVGDAEISEVAPVLHGPADLDVADDHTSKAIPSA